MKLWCEIKEDNSSYENEKNYSADNVEIESVIEDDLNCDNKDLDEDKEDLTAEVLLFEVVFKQNDGKSVEAILSLEDLKYWAPTLLTKFLQTRLEVAAENKGEENIALAEDTKLMLSIGKL